MIWTIVAIVLLPLALLVVLPLISDTCSLIVVAWNALRRAERTRAEPPHQRLLILVPAHDEELLVARAVRSMLAMHRERCDYDLVVVADNCSDRTAAIARAAGARVLERTDPDHRGKPHALNWAMRQLPINEYDAAAILDADAVVDPSFADALAHHAPLRGKAVQSYSGISNEGESWLTVLGALLVTMRYELQFVLKARAELSCPIANGCCIGTDLLAKTGGIPDSLTETWELYARYTAIGAPVEFASDARVGCQEAHTLAEGATQRRRWQAGKLLVFRHWSLRILTSRAIGFRRKLDAIGELAAVGPVLHATVAVPLAIGMSFMPSILADIDAALLAVSLVPVVGWTAAAIYRQPNRARVVAALAHIPVYAIWRVAVGAQAFATARRGVWHRSPRHVSA